MEQLVINVPDKKSALVKQILEELGVTIQQPQKGMSSEYKEKIAKISVWSDEDLKIFDESRKAFNSLKPAEW